MENSAKEIDSLFQDLWSEAYHDVMKIKKDNAAGKMAIPDYLRFMERDYRLVAYKILEKYINMKSNEQR